MNFQDLKFNEDSPIYLQVVRYFKRKILIGELQNGDELPSRRIMATTMGLNLTTIQKIYKQLEDEKLIDTQPNSKTLVCYNDKQVKEIENELIRDRVIKFVDELRECNVSREKAITIINEEWNKYLIYRRVTTIKFYLFHDVISE